MEKFITEHPSIFRFFVTFKIVSIILGAIAALVFIVLLITVLIPAMSQAYEESGLREQAFDAYYTQVIEDKTQADTKFDENMGRIQSFFAEAEAMHEGATSTFDGQSNDFNERYAAAYTKVFSGRNED